MSTWPTDVLRKIVEADDLHIAPFREDGKTYGTPTWIWSVAVGGALYVRAYSGRNSRWYQAAIKHYPSDLTESQREVVNRFLPEPKSGPGKPAGGGQTLGGGARVCLVAALSPP